ncbi:MAG: MFS transporter [Rhodospirillaceae bacterium]|nr:MFS transporter [Rhodospirillaceae bacterium]
MTTKAGPHWEWIVLAAAGSMVITMGARQSIGLFVAPLDLATGLGLAKISLALAIGQFMWGFAQPIAGAVADRYGPGRMIGIGLVMLVIGNILTPFMTSLPGLSFTIGVLAAGGAGCASYSVLMGAVGRRLAPEKRGPASGLVGAGGSLGQFIFAPLMGAIITGWGWQAAMWVCAAIVACALPLAFVLRAPPSSTPGLPLPQFLANMGKATRSAMGDRSYLLLHASFFTCGFHIAFLVTHLPGEIGLCGLPPSVASWSLAIIGLSNVVGSLLSGWCIGRYLSKHVLFAMYASRALLILIYLASPKTDVTFYIFAAGLGLTWLATVPPTAMMVNKLFGTRYLSTLVGLTLLSHQIGAFFGAWLGGLVFTATGTYTWMWYIDIALAGTAALLNIPIREPKSPPVEAAA